MLYIQYLIPEQQHERLEESAEVVVVIDSCVFIQFNVAKHLQKRHSNGKGFVPFIFNIIIFA